MTDEPATIPDVLPVELEEEHLAAARELVHRSRGGPGHGPDDGLAVPLAGAVAADPARRVRPRGRLSWLPAYEVSLATAATVIGLVGVAALTTWWSWLALTHDPMWWAFTGVGAALLGLLAWAAVALQGHRRRLAAARRWVPPAPASR